jgi:D-alanyl-D-alanine carboxypeptidase
LTKTPWHNTSVFYDTTNDTTVIVQTNSDIAAGDGDVLLSNTGLT